MTGKRKTITKQLPEEGVRENIVTAARSLFAQHGYNGVSVRDIVAHAGVNVSLVSYHFGGKENLFRACIENVTRDYLSLAVKILKTPTTREEFKTRLKIFIEEVLLEHQENSETIKLVFRELDNNSDILSAETSDIIMRPFHKVGDFFAEAQKLKLIRSDVDPVLLAVMLYSVVAHQVRFDALRKNMRGVSLESDERRTQLAHQLVIVVCEGLMT